ncbi:MAG: extracellular solute-binding protein [Clostridia bacterium]|nr:extracellular solute-binding protein [Clostridia bacterium]
MVTIKDIAREAGVSQGTVSNVLNGRGNVSSEKIRLVQEACRRLGYVPNERAKVLRRGSNRVLGVIVPALEEKRHTDFFSGFRAHAESHGYEARLYILRSDDREAEEAALRDAQSDMVSGIALFSRCRGARLPSGEGAPAVLHIEHAAEGCRHFIGFDTEAAGRALAGRLLSRGVPSATLISGSLRFPDEAAFVRGFTEAAEAGGCIVHPIATDLRRVRLALLQASEQYADSAVVCSRLELARTVRSTTQVFLPEPRPAIYCLSPLFTLPEPDFYKYEFDYRQLGSRAAGRLLRILSGEPAEASCVLPAAGFRSFAAPSVRPEKNEALNIVTLDSPAAATLRSMATLYTQQTGVPVNITVYSYDATSEVYAGLQRESVFDIIRLDITWLSWLAEKILVPLTDIDPDIPESLGSFLRGVPERCCRVGRTLYTLPASPSMQMLFYRTDLFESAILRRLYQERCHEELRVPRTFTEFNRIAAFFSRQSNPESPVPYGATLTLGSTGVTGSEYLCRLFALQENLYDGEGRIRLDSEAGILALRQMIRLKGSVQPGGCPWWTDTARSFARGDTAMAILYNNFAAPLVGHHSRVQDNLGYAMVPGGNPQLGGGALGISRHSRNKKESLAFLRWLIGEPVASAVGLLCGVAPSAAAYENYEILGSYPWLRLVRDRYHTAKGFRQHPEDPRPFNERLFISLLGIAVKNALSGAMTPEQALRSAQLRFEEEFPEFA